MFIKFVQTATHLFPTAGIVNIPMVRVGSANLGIQFRVLVHVHTISGIAPIPDKHFRCVECGLVEFDVSMIAYNSVACVCVFRAYPPEGRTFSIGPTARKRTIPFEIFPEAFTYLTELRHQHGVSDSVLEVELELVEGNNTLVPETKDEGRSITIRLTLEGQQPLPSRLGEVNTAAITLSCVCFVIVVAWAIRMRRKILKRQRGDEHTALSLIKDDSMLQSADLGRPHNPLDAEKNRMSEYLSGTVKWRRKKQYNTAIPSPRVLSSVNSAGAPQAEDTIEVLGVPESDSQLVFSPGRSSAVSPREVGFASSRVTSPISRSSRGSPSVQSPVVMNQLQDSIGHSETQPFPSGRSATLLDASPRTQTTASVRKPSRSGSRLAMDATPTLRESPPFTPQPSTLGIPESSVLSPNGVPLFATDHLVSSNARVRALRTSSRSGFTP